MFMNEELIELYKKTSKHSNYQILPSSLKNIIDESIVPTISRYENERMDFLKKQLSFQNKKVLDIGGNTGFFSFEAIEAGAEQATLIEGNSAHETFVKKAAQITNKNISTNNYYLDFKTNNITEPYDIVLLFNVIHHLGDDFGDKTIALDDAKVEMQNAINFFTDKTDLLVLQMGFCWKGDKNLLLFENGTKKEMIEFVTNSIKDKWEVQAIGVAEEIAGKTTYNKLDDQNIERYDSLGEFRNRPIFILKKKTKVFNRIEELEFLDHLVSDYKDDSPYSKIKKNIILDLIKSNVDLDVKSKKALQLGCSNGYETEQLSKIFNNLYVADGSQKFINKVKSLHRNVNFVHTLFEDIDVSFSNEKFDFIFCHYILEHVFDSVLILQKLKSLLVPEGVIFIVVPNANALSRQLAQKIGLIENLTDLTKNDLDHGHRRVYTHTTIIEDIKKADLKINKINGLVFKILADFQLNELLRSGFLKEEHILGMQKMALIKENIQFSDSFFAVVKA